MQSGEVTLTLKQHSGIFCLSYGTIQNKFSKAGTAQGPPTREIL